MQRLTQTLEFQSQALVLRAERQRLLASNIANADTPGYQAREMNFAAALREATAGLPGTSGVSGLAAGAGIASVATPAASMAATDPRHATAAVDDSGNGESLLFARYSQDAVDRNTVDLDRERASFADNSVKYEATLRFINGSVRSLLDAMKSPAQG